VRTDRERLEDILERCVLLREHVAAQAERLEHDPVIRGAALYWILIIGEAAANVSPELREQHPEIPWRDVIGMRNVLIHGYAGTDIEIVREVIEGYVPTLDRQIRTLLAELP
jgi:uncharacterized protein with HEPN domain